MTSGLGKNVLITGANRGIGLGLVNKLAVQADIQHIFAGCRNPEKATDLKSLQEKNPSIKLIPIDVGCDESIKKAFEIVNNELGSNGKLNLLINNAGILDPVSIIIFVFVYFQKGGSTKEPERNAYIHHFDVNTIGAVIVNSRFLPLLRQAAKSKEFARIVNVSSFLGSCTLTKSSKLTPHGNAAYCMSKAALNSYTRCLAGDERDITSIVLDPGWVQTDMGGKNATLTIDDATEAIIKLISNLQKKDSGSFLNKNGVVPF